jgi:hypothetical protein
VSLSKATLFFVPNQGGSMPKLIIYLRDQDHDALEELAQQEYRLPKAQAALMIRQELEKRGLVTETNVHNAEEEEADQYEQPLAS